MFLKSSELRTLTVVKKYEINTQCDSFFYSFASNLQSRSEAWYSANRYQLKDSGRMRATLYRRSEGIHCWNAVSAQAASNLTAKSDWEVMGICQSKKPLPYRRRKKRISRREPAPKRTGCPVCRARTRASGEGRGPSDKFPLLPDCRLEIQDSGGRTPLQRRNGCESTAVKPTEGNRRFRGALSARAVKSTELIYTNVERRPLRTRYSQ